MGEKNSKLWCKVRQSTAMRSWILKSRNEAAQKLSFANDQILYHLLNEPKWLAIYFREQLQKNVPHKIDHNFAPTESFLEN